MADQMGVHPVRYRLPTAYYAEIGRIMQKWAFFEWRLRSIAYLLLDLNPKYGRIAVREPRATDYLTMLEDLMKVAGIKSILNFKDFRKVIVRMTRYRDALAHGVWLKHSLTQKPVLQVVAGSYQPSPGAKSVKARIDPSSIEMDIENLKGITAGIEAAIGAVGRLKLDVARQIEERRKESAE